MLKGGRSLCKREFGTMSELPQPHACPAAVLRDELNAGGFTGVAENHPAYEGSHASLEGCGPSG